VNEDGQRAEPSRSLIEALDAIREGDLSHTRVARLSDLTRAEARTLAEAWQTIPEPTRVDLVRRCDELSEDRIDVNFRRALRVALDDFSPVVRQLAIRGLWEDDSSEMFERLSQLMRSDPSPDVQAEAAGALERFSTKAVTGELDAGVIGELRDSLLHAASGAEVPFGVQRKALESLGPFGADPDVATVIAAAYESGDHGLQCSAIYAMGRSLQARWQPTIFAELENDDPELRFEAARAAGALGATDAIPALLDAAHDDDPEVRHAAIGAIGQIGGRGAVRALERLTEDAGDADMELFESTIEDVNALLEPFQSS
jgi:HEAT repeat protein